MSTALRLLTPAWPAPAAVRACFTTRHGGVSRGPWHGLNLALHVGDEAAAVHANRALLQEHLGLAESPCWVEQVHGSTVVRAPAGAGAAADAVITTAPGVACAIMVADCLPVLLCAADGSEVAAVHAGWRGLDGGVIAAAVGAFACPPAALLAWLGPAIGPRAYQVGADLRTRFIAADAAHVAAFHADGEAWTMDLAQIARRQLAQLGVHRVWQHAACVCTQAEDYYSFRRDRQTGRMAALIWRSTD